METTPQPLHLDPRPYHPDDGMPDLLPCRTVLPPWQRRNGATATHYCRHCTELAFPVAPGAVSLACNHAPTCPASNATATTRPLRRTIGLVSVGTGSNGHGTKEA